MEGAVLYSTQAKYRTPSLASGVPRGDAQDARASPLPPCASPPGHVHPPPPQPERLVMRKDEAVAIKKKMQVCLNAN
jgi:hypothetical protein